MSAWTWPFSPMVWELIDDSFTLLLKFTLFWSLLSAWEEPYVYGICIVNSPILSQISHFMHACVMEALSALLALCAVDCQDEGPLIQRFGCLLLTWDMFHCLWKHHTSSYDIFVMRRRHLIFKTKFIVNWTPWAHHQPFFTIPWKLS